MATCAGSGRQRLVKRGPGQILLEEFPCRSAAISRAISWRSATRNRQDYGRRSANRYTAIVNACSHFRAILPRPMTDIAQGAPISTATSNTQYASVPKFQRREWELSAGSFGNIQRKVPAPVPSKGCSFSTRPEADPDHQSKSFTGDSCFHSSSELTTSYSNLNPLATRRFGRIFVENHNFRIRSRLIPVLMPTLCSISNGRTARIS